MAHKNKYSSDSQKKVTIVFGYSLFALTIAILIVSTIVPWVTLYLSPQVYKVNVAVTLIALIAGAILPMLVSFIIGGKATHTKSKLVRHYNGVLFGIAAYWVSLFFMFVSITDIFPSLTSLNADYPYTFGVMLNAWPIVATLVIMTIVAFGYAHHQDHKVSVLQHLPYQIAISVAFLGTFVYGAVNSFTQGGTDAFIVTAVYTIIALLTVGLSYKALSGVQPQKIPRLMHGVVAVSMGLIFASIVGQFLSALPYNLNLMVSMVGGLVVWIVYLGLVHRAK